MCFLEFNHTLRFWVRFHIMLLINIFYLSVTCNWIFFQFVIRHMSILNWCHENLLPSLVHCFLNVNSYSKFSMIYALPYADTGCFNVSFLIKWKLKCSIPKRKFINFGKYSTMFPIKIMHNICLHYIRFFINMSTLKPIQFETRLYIMRI